MNPTEIASLVSALDHALLVAEKARTSNNALLFQVWALRDNASSVEKEFVTLLSVIQRIPALESFREGFQCGPGHYEPISFYFLVGWLISRGQQVGAACATSDLNRYLASETIEISTILAFDGVQVEHVSEIGEYKLVAWNDVTLSDTKFQIAARSLFGGRLPSAALTQVHRIPRAHIQPWDSQTHHISYSLEPRLDLLRCITAIAETGTRLLHYWIEPQEWAPWVPSRSSFGVDTTTLSHSKKLEETDVHRVRESFLSLQNMSDSEQLRLRIPFDRLNKSYLSGIGNIEKAIELGIALESLYAPAKLSEGIAFAVRTRAARFLDGSSDQRSEIVKTLRDVYDLRSRAVHAGRFNADSNNNKWKDENRVQNTLEKGQRLVGRSLIKVLQIGEPNWDDFDIGITEQTATTADDA